MNKVFIGGSRRISHLSPAVQERLQRIVDKGLPVLLGDAHGADKAVQRFLHERGYQNVKVYCAGGACRNNLGNWPLRVVKPSSTRPDFDYFAEKDRVMATEADFGLMIWDGKSLGTVMNVFRLARQGKKVVVYEARATQPIEVATETDVARLLAHCDSDVQRRVMKHAQQEHLVSPVPQQVGLF